MRLAIMPAASIACAALSACTGGGVPLGTMSSVAPAYALGAGDRLHVNVFGEDAISGDYSIAPDGSLPIPLIGNVPARGATPADLARTIAARLAAGYVRDPKVSVDVLVYRPFYILGEVNRPGQYPYVDQMTAAQAVATAGGYTYRANPRTIFIRHRDEAQEHAYPLKNGSLVWVMPGDTVRVGERYF